jgi:hypothetical protein
VVNVASLTVDQASGGKVDLGRGLINIASGSAADLVADILAGRGDGSWNGTSGITSSAAASSGGLRTVGWLDNGDGSLAVAYAAGGDTNLDWMVDILHDPAQTGVVAVTTPEEMPILETKQLLATLASETKVAVAAAVMNRMPDIVAHGATLSAIDTIIDERPGIFGTEALQGIVTANQLATARRREAEYQFAALREVVGGAFPIITQPNIAVVPEESTMAREVANSLIEESA